MVGFPKYLVLAHAVGRLKSRFAIFNIWATRYMTAATLERSRQCSWIEWSLLTPLIPLVRPESLCYGPEGEIRALQKSDRPFDEDILTYGLSHVPKNAYAPVPSWYP